MNETTRHLEDLASRSVDTRYEASEAIRELIMSIRAALCARVSLEGNELVLLSVLQKLQLVSLSDEELAPIREIARDDRRPLVRAQAAYALSSRSNLTIIDFFVGQLTNERNARVRIELLLALYSAGIHSVIGSILETLSNADYRTQCAAINGLVALQLDRDREQAIAALNLLIGRDAPEAVTSTAARALKELQAPPG